MSKFVIATMLALPLAVSSAYAQDASNLHISGYGTAALTATNTNDAEFARPNQASGVKKNPRTGVDSNLGIQVDYTVNSWLSVTAQGLVRKDAEDDYGAEAPWAFVKAKLSDNLSVRVGRVGVASFMISDYRNVGYSNTFLRPPAEVYSQQSVNSLDGADVTWQQQIADTTITAQLALGHGRQRVPGGITGVANQFSVINITAEHGPFTLRVGRTAAKVSAEGSPELDKLTSTFTSVAAGYNLPQLNDMAALINKPNQKGSFTSVGLSMDWSNVIAQTEYAERKLHSVAGKTASWYVLGGYRFGKLLPYYSHAKLSVTSDFTNTVPTACAAGMPASCTATVGMLYGIMEAMRSNALGQAQSTDSIGLRWDVTNSVDLKVQVDRVKTNGPGLFVHAAPGFHGPVTVGAVALDFVF